MHCSRCDRSHPPARGQRRAWVSPGPAHAPRKALTNQFRRRRLKEQCFTVPASLVKLVASQCKQFCTMRVPMAACGRACMLAGCRVKRTLWCSHRSCLLIMRRAPSRSDVILSPPHRFPALFEPSHRGAASSSLRRQSFFSHHRSGCIISDWCHRR
jgi:hypothetical protein